MDPAITISALGAIAAWLALLKSERSTYREKEQREQEAINAICSAAEETRKYVAVTKPPAGSGTQPRDYKREIELSNFWMRAGNLLSSIDIQLAQRCEFKSGYWRNPAGWTDAQIRKANIQLQDIYEKACDLRRTT